MIPLNILPYADDLGAAKVVYLYNPRSGLKAVVVIDNIACGPSIGGVRMAPDVTVEEAFRLARAMTFKNAAAGLAHGGGKSVIQADPKKLTVEEKEKLIRAFAREIRDLTDYIPGPDMGTDEICMAWIKDEINRSVGLPRVIGGIPLDEIGATGIGLLAAAEVACDLYGISLPGARVAIQGFGAVGKHTARFMSQKGALVVSVADSQTTITDEEGLDIEKLIEMKNEGLPLRQYAKAKIGDPGAVIGVSCDIWIPAARPDVVNLDNIHQLQTKLILEGANIPITEEAEKVLYEKGVHVIPDFIANAGGVICASVEYHGGTEQTARQVIHQKISANTQEVIKRSRDQKIPPRIAANQLARERVKEALQYRR